MKPHLSSRLFAILAGIAQLVALTAGPRVSAQSAPEPAAGSGALSNSGAGPDEPVELPVFDVNSLRDDGYIASQATASSRIAENLEDIPQNITVINAEMAKAIMPISQTTDILQYVAGLTGASDERGGATFTLRGFQLNEVMLNGQLGTRNWGLLPESLQQLEIVRGASAVLYGSSQPGGVINYVTKSPQFDQFRGSLTGSEYFLHDQGGGSAVLDIGGPLRTLLTTDHDGRATLAYRLVIVKENRNDYRGGDADIDFYKREGVYGKVAWAPVKGLQLWSQYEYADITFFANSALLIPLQDPTLPADKVRLPDAYGIPVDWTFRDATSVTRTIGRTWQSAATYTANLDRFGTWTARSMLTWSPRYLYSVGGFTGPSQPRAVTAADIGKVVNYTQTVTAEDVAEGRLIVPARSQVLAEYKDPANYYSLWDINGKLSTGPIDHDILLGTSMICGTDIKYGIGQGQIDTLTSTADGTKYATWVDDVNHTPIPVNWADIRSPSNPNGTITQSWGGATRNASTQVGFRYYFPWLWKRPDTYYFGDTISLFNKRLLLSYSARNDRLYETIGDNISQFTNWTQRGGVLYRFNDHVSAFGLYNESFVLSGDALTAASALNRVVEPQTGRDYETGLRLYALDRKISLDVTLFDVQSKNIVERDPYLAASDPGEPQKYYFFLDGITSRGMDWDLKLNWGSRLQTIIGYTQQDAIAKPTLAQAEATPGLTGVQLVNVPKSSATMFTTWRPEARWLPGLSLTAGVRYLSRRPGGNPGALPSYYMPGYTIVDAGFGYRYRNCMLRLMVKNVFDKYAYRASASPVIVVPERPRTGIVAVDYNF